MKASLLFSLSMLIAVGAAAQTPNAAATPDAGSPIPLGGAAGCTGFNSHQWRLEGVTATHWKLTGQVEVECEQVKFFADQVELFTDTNRLVASGNVVFTNPQGRISAETMEFDTKNMLGTFRQASGIMSLGPLADRSEFGGQDPDVYFYGDLVEKIGDTKYKLTNGVFTTCVQPTPRWELASGSVVINLDDYAVLRNTVLRVKGVPMFYIPYAYYPLQEDQRATGFLLPKYGTSLLRGQAISNGFFWAINRSQDATFMHDWFTRTGQGFGAEYRYIAAAGSEGSFRLYRFNQKAAEFTLDSGTITRLDPAQSVEVTGNATQALPGGLRSRVRLDYFSNVITQQLYHQNLYDASRRSRSLGASLNGAWGPYSLSSVYQQSEAFEGASGSILYGSIPRISLSLAQQRMFGLPIYGGATSEYGYLLYRDKRGRTPDDRSLGRADFHPALRVPFSTLAYLTVNTSAAYRLTYYTDSLDMAGRRDPSALTRSYFSVRSDVIGPVFTRIFNTPTNAFAERYKHVIEPTFTFEQITDMDNYNRVVILTDNSDLVVGGLRRFTYGVTNRLLARTHPRDGVPGQAREVLTAAIQQTYYGSPEAAQYDVNYASANRSNLSNLSPVALTVRFAPASSVDTSLRIEQSVRGLGMQVLSLSSSVRAGVTSVSSSWSRRRLSLASPPDSYLSTSAGVSAKEGRVSGAYSLSWDISRGYVVSQTGRMQYNAQCCGIGVEYQSFSYPQVSSQFPLPADRRINFSFMLAGLGTFQNFFGAFGGPR